MSSGACHYCRKWSCECLDESRRILTWIDFAKSLPQDGQAIYVLDRFGNIQDTYHQGEWQKTYWIDRGYLWLPRPNLVGARYEELKAKFEGERTIEELLNSIHRDLDSVCLKIKEYYE